MAADAPARPSKTWGGKGLTARQARFVAEYLVCLNATQAAKTAGYAHPHQQGPRLLANVGVSSAIAKAQKSEARKLNISQRKVLRETARLAFSDVNDFYLGDDGRIHAHPWAPTGATRAIKSVKYRTTTDKEGHVHREAEIRLWDKPQPLKLAGRHVGLFPDKVEVSGPNGGPIPVGVMMAALRDDPELSARMTRALQGHVVEAEVREIGDGEEA